MTMVKQQAQRQPPLSVPDASEQLVCNGRRVGRRQLGWWQLLAERIVAWCDLQLFLF